MNGMADVLHKLGNCCACYTPMVMSHHLNMINLDKYKTWEFPGWGNILAKDDDKRSSSRACAVLCDWCIDSGNKPILALELEHEGDETRIQYHCVDLLEDSDPITDADLEDPWRART